MCSCQTKAKISDLDDLNIDKKRLFSNFKKIINVANLELIKCAHLLFNDKNFFSNSANYIISIIFILSIITLYRFISLEYQILQNFIDKIVTKKTSAQEKPVVNHIININRRKINPKLISRDSSRKRMSLNFNIYNGNMPKMDFQQNEIRIKTDLSEENDSNIKFENLKNGNDMVAYPKKEKEKEEDILAYNDHELNLLNYKDALKYDHRTYWEYYLSLLRTQHILFFTLYKGNDYNIRIIKIYLFFFTFAINYSVSILFYNYETMHKIYEESGAFNFIYQIPQILYSAIITGILRAIVTKLGLCENNILVIKNAKLNDLENQKKKGLKIIYIKFVLFFVVTYVLLTIFWVYSISFCVVYKNTQIHLLKDVILSFLTSFVYPIIIYLLPGFFRIHSLKNKKGKKHLLYNFSKIIQMF